MHFYAAFCLTVFGPIEQLQAQGNQSGVKCIDFLAFELGQALDAELLSKIIPQAVIEVLEEHRLTVTVAVREVGLGWKLGYPQ